MRGGFKSKEENPKHEDPKSETNAKFETEKTRNARAARPLEISKRLSYWHFVLRFALSAQKTK